MGILEQYAYVYDDKMTVI